MQVHSLPRIRVYVYLCLLAFLGISKPASGQTEEFRGVWVDAWGNGFLNASQVTTLVNHCRTYNFNAVIVQMRRRGDAFYMPQAPNLEPRTTALASNYDALQEIINQCHNGTPRIEVHCWVPTFLVGDSSSPTKTGHVMNVRPDLLMKNSAGSTFIGEGYYLDPGNPDAQTWNYNMARDIVSRYNIDGFHWDYIRYPTTDSGYNNVSISRYNADYGLTGQPQPTDPNFSDWRRRQVTEFLRWVNADLLMLKPNLILSASVFSSRSDAFNARFQDWAAWNNEGLLDICMPMTYTDDNAIFNSRVNDAYNNQGVRRVYVGPGAYLNTKENTLVQLNYVRSKGFKGSVLYSYRVPNSGTVNQTATFTYIRDNYQPSPATVPTLPWKTNPSKGIIKGTVTRQGSNTPLYTAAVTLSGPTSRNQNTESHGRYAFYETTPGTYTVRATFAGLNPATNTVTLNAGQIVTVNLVLSTNDTTPPVLSGYQVKNLTDTSATISWNTDELADSAIDYGPSIAYGNTVSNGTLKLSHELNLSNLSPNTTYNYRVRSRDNSNNQAVSANRTFKTNPSGVVNDVIIESRQANGNITSAALYTDVGFANSTLKSSAPPLSGSTEQGSRYAGSGTPSFTVTPTLPVASGTYDVYLTHGSASSVSADAVVAVAQSGCSGLPGTTTLFRSPGANTWELLGRMVLNSGVSTPTLTFTWSSGTLSGSSRMYADAVKFVHITTPPVITVHPQSQTAIGGSPVTLSVQASGASLNYQWYKNSNLISGATASSYVRESVDISDQGIYHVTINNSAGTATSSSANLQVRFALNTTATSGGVITKNPNQANYTLDTVVTVTANPSAGFSFAGWSGDVNGLENPLTLVMSESKSLTATFQPNVPDQIVDNPDATFTGTWNTSAAADVYGSNFRDANTTTSGTPSATAMFRPNLPEAGKYDVYVWYPTLLSTRSTNAQYVVAHSGGNSTYSVNQTTNTGSWRLLGAGIQFSAGTNGYVLLQNNTGESSRKVFADAVKWSLSSNQSSPPLLVSQPRSIAVRLGDEATFSVVAGGTAPFTYQWRFQGTNIAGATANVLTRPEVQNHHLGNYSVVVSNALGTATSTTATLDLIPPSEPILHSVLMTNQAVRFVIEGEPGYSYSIEVSTNLTDWNILTNISNESGSVEVIDPGSSNQVRRFYRSRWH